MTALEAAFREHQALLWGLSYRMLGTAADADEALQESFVKALRSPPASDRPLRPWLVRVVLNTSRDKLRRRRRAPYVGPWLPSPVDELGSGGLPVPAVDPELPGERLETVSYALLVALERLTPGQRAVWLLREVMGLSTAEAAEILAIGDGSVKVSLHRARKALSDAMEPQSELGPGLAAVGALAACILQGDVEGVVALLDADAVALSDGGGVYHAATRPVRGPERVARLLIGLARKTPGGHYEAAVIGGCPAVVLRSGDRPSRFATLAVTMFGVRHGRVHRVWTVLAPHKLAGGQLAAADS
ncbi:MAG: sigma-70 family RNA polymerase sigma factor [Deltaproteobacteria bacterium]|nr:MAG: sigma-70 family RNA polymerase sigma factor [Deltaproteobacteria bacterium]